MCSQNCYQVQILRIGATYSVQCSKFISVVANSFSYTNTRSMSKYSSSLSSLLLCVVIKKKLVECPDQLSLTKP